MSSEKTVAARQVQRALALVFRTHRKQLAKDLFKAIREAEGISNDSCRVFEELHDWSQQVVFTAVDLAIQRFASDDPSVTLLFHGWIYSQMKLPGLEFTNPELFDPADLVARLRPLWVETVRSDARPEEQTALADDLEVMLNNFSRPTKKSLRLLFVGDCLKWEIMNAVVGPCIDHQIKITHKELGERILPVLRNQIRALDQDAYDLVFFSPFTHQFFPEYAQLLKPEAALWSRTKLFTALDGLLDEVISTVHALAQHTTCPIYVHNTAATVQMFGVASGFVKNAAAQWNRGPVREIIHIRLTRALADPALAGRGRLLDEKALLQDFSTFKLGKVFFNGLIFHPARIGIELGQRSYFEALFSAAYLANKKVVVCDLDNTLWDGVIGEGSVTHLPERQQTLKQLRDRGVLLSINSKNDPEKVHFTGAALRMEDFVAPRINWQPKTSNMAAIIDDLNIKVKDFVFIDDRPDELERMQKAFPELVTLDATQPRTWKLLQHWATHLSSEMQEDRTKLYHERAARDQFLSANPMATGAQEDEAAAFADLQLSVKIETVNRSGLKRVVELINRTNQFNLCGSRTTLRDEETGLGDDHWIITAAAKDKFGSMGVVGAMRVNRRSDHIEIPIFVLSCRVFGFGIEYALLNAVKHLVPANEAIVGLYKETQANEPGRQLYAKSGLQWDGEKWTGKVSEISPAPNWLSVEVFLK